MVKTSTIVAVAVLGGVAVLLYYFIGGGSSGQGSTTNPSQASNTDVHPSPAGYSTASGPGSLSITQIYSPATSYTSSYQQTTSITTDIKNQLGLFNR